MKKSNTVTRWIWWASLIIVGILVYRAVGNFSGFTAGISAFIGIFTPFIIGFIITFLLYAPCNRLEKALRRVKNKAVQVSARYVSVGVVYILFLAVVAGILVLLLPALYNGILSLIKNMPTYYAQVMDWLETYTAEGRFLDRLGLTETVNSLYQTAYEKLMSLANTDTLLTAFQGLVSVTSSVVDVVMALIVSVYMLAQRDALLRVAKSLFAAVCSEKTVKTLSLYAHKSASIFYNYLYGALVDAVVVAVLMVIGLSLFRLPQAVLIGCLIGLLNFIPYFGAIIGGMVAVLVALVSQNIYSAIGVLIYVVVIQQLDANILQPKIVSSAVGMRAIYVLFAITVGGGLFGFWGMLISVPMMAILKMLVQDFIAYRKRKKAELTVE